MERERDRGGAALQRLHGEDKTLFLFFCACVFCLCCFRVFVFN